MGGYFLQIMDSIQRLICLYYLISLNRIHKNFHLRGSSGFPASSAPTFVFRENNGSKKTPKFAQSDAMLCPIAQKRAKTRKRDLCNRILHKICDLLALVLG